MCPLSSTLCPFNSNSQKLLTPNFKEFTEELEPIVRKKEKVGNRIRIKSGWCPEWKTGSICHVYGAKLYKLFIWFMWKNKTIFWQKKISIMFYVNFNSRLALCKICFFKKESALTFRVIPWKNFPEQLYMFT